MKEKGGRILWLAYIDATLTKSQGRIIPRNYAVPKPTLEEAARALEKLGLRYKAYNKRYPALWYDERGQGYFVVYTSEKTKKIALLVAGEIAKSRG